MAKKKTVKKAETPIGGVCRVFKYNGLELEDVGSDKSPAEVKDFYSQLYPALLNASIKGPEQSGDKLIFTFKVSTGSRG